MTESLQYDHASYSCAKYNHLNPAFTANMSNWCLENQCTEDITTLEYWHTDVYIID